MFRGHDPESTGEVLEMGERLRRTTRRPVRLCHPRAPSTQLRRSALELWRRKEVKTHPSASPLWKAHWGGTYSDRTQGWDPSPQAGSRPWDVEEVI